MARKEGSKDYHIETKLEAIRVWQVKTIFTRDTIQT
jgi:hypothetical protein